MSAYFDPSKANSIGVQLVLTLVEQLDGHLEIVRQNGTVFRVKFPLEAAA
jgi:two-component sensor histidine kinase